MKPILLPLVLVLILALAGCAPAATPTVPAAGAALTINGAVAKAQTFKLDALKAMPAAQIKAEHPKLGMQDYSGVRLNALLDASQPNAGASRLILVASDGFSADVALADARKCADCLISINGAKLDAAMPGLPSNNWVRDLVRIEVK